VVAEPLNRSFGNQTITPGVFDTPDDDAQGGAVVFSFAAPGGLTLESIDLLDIDGGAATDVVLTDVNGLTRFYDVPSHWTRDIDSAGPDGYGTLLLTLEANQAGETGALALFSQDAGFDETAVATLRVAFSGSGALDNLVFGGDIPAPGAASALALAAGGLVRRRR